MATNLQIKTRVYELTGLQTTGTEATLVQAAVNDAYKRSVLFSGANEISADKTFATSTSDYSWSSAWSLTDILRVESLQVVQGSNEYDLTPKSQNEILRLRRSNAGSGIPSYFAPMGLAKIMFWPNPSVGDTLRIRYHQRPTDLSGDSDVPSAIPEEFHWSVILPGAVYQALQKDQRGKDAQDWYGLWQAGLTELREHVDMFLPQGSVFVDLEAGFSLDPDQRGRW